MKNAIESLGGYIQKHPKTDLAILAIGLGIFLIITLLNVSHASLWFDEAFSAYITQYNFWDIARYTSTDVHPPFYYWLLKIWSSLFGTTELAFRSLSIVLGAGAIGTAFALTRKLFGRKIAWLALVFMVLSPMFIRYSDEARMYTLASLIVMSATYVLVKARETKKTNLWVLYGVLVSLGMWTHYFTALVWLAHWLWWGMETWRHGMSFKQFVKAFFTKQWIIAYATAIVLYLPWLPFMALQLGIVQGGGFWIGPVGVDTPANYLSNYFYYLEHGQVQGWLALALIWVAIVAIIAAPRAYKALKKSEKSSFMLITALAIATPVLLFFASMPPLRSSFVERYLIPSTIALSIFLAVVLIKGTRKWKPFWRVLPPVLIVAMMSFGISNVYYYGNYNKNSSIHIMTREAVERAQENSSSGTPIIASSPWIFYEAVAYSTPEHPVYFIDANTKYEFGSLDMLKYNDDHKIEDIDAFTTQYPTFWYIGTTKDDDIAPYKDEWNKVLTVRAYDPIDGVSLYKATKYTVIEE